MKTRVARHWSGTDWVFTVQRWVQVMPDDKFHNWRDLPDWKPPEVGTWRWELYIVPNGGEPGIWQFSRDRATSIASRLALNLPQEDADVIAEFGE